MVTSVIKSRRLVRKSRALGVPLTAKAEKIFNKKKDQNKPIFAPGDHGGTGQKQKTDYALRLKEKQKLKAYYQVREKQLRKAYEYAKTKEGLTGEVLLETLETRLDTLVLRAGFARSILQARQAVVHRHILVDGKILDRPSTKIKVNQTISVKPTSQVSTQFQVSALGAHLDSSVEPIPYLDTQIEKLTTQLTRLPKRGEIPVEVNEQFVVEYYAR